MTTSVTAFIELSPEHRLEQARLNLENAQRQYNEALAAKQSHDERQRRMNAPLGPNVGFSLMR